MNANSQFEYPQGFVVRQSSAAFGRAATFQSGRGLPQSKALARGKQIPNA
jgi:hypothetical protein